MIGQRLGGEVRRLLLAAPSFRGRPDGPSGLRKHDSFFVGRRLLHHLVRNGAGSRGREQRNPGTYLSGAAAARERVRAGTFPSFIVKQFVSMLEYFGQSPIIVRSSSLLEDSFGNAFTGKYDSVFCPNQGSPQERLETFLAAVRDVYASTMSEDGFSTGRTGGLSTGTSRWRSWSAVVGRPSGDHVLPAGGPGWGFPNNPTCGAMR
jgi:hypothetical protein